MSVCPILLLLLLSVSVHPNDDLFENDDDFYDMLKESETDETDNLTERTTTTTTTTTITTTSQRTNQTHELGRTDKAAKAMATATNIGEILKIVAGVLTAIASFYAAVAGILKYRLKMSTRQSLLLGLPRGRRAETRSLDASDIPVSIRTRTV